MNLRNGTDSHAIREAESLDWPAELDTFARQLIVLRAKQVSRHPGFTKSDIPDLIQILMFRAWQSLSSYDPAKGRWTTYVRRTVDAEVVTLLRQTRARKRECRNGVSLNRAVGDSKVERGKLLSSEDDQRIHCYKRSASKRAEVVADVRAVLDALPKELRKVAKQYMRSESQTATARALKTSRRSVRRDMARIKTLFEDAGLEPLS